MRVLILHSRYLSGDASGENAVVEDEARLLAKAGHTVHVWKPSPKAATPTALAKIGIRAIWSEEAVTQVARAVTEGSIDVVHCHNLFPMLSPAILRVAERQGAALLMTLHNYRLMCVPSTLLRDGRICEDCVGRLPWPGVIHRCYRNSLLGSAALATSLSMHRALRTFDRVALFLPVSDFVRLKYIQAGFPPDRLRLKSNFSWPAKRRDGSGNYFLFLGRLSPEKGVQTLLEAWKSTTAKLLIAGDGPQTASLRNAAPPGVEFTGPVLKRDVPTLLRSARALLLPSLWYEAQPRVILEAYATGVPVIASQIGGMPDLVVEGESGMLVPPHDRAAWTEAVDRLTDEAESARLGNGAYRLWQERYSPERGLDALEDAYRDALSRAGS